MARESLIELGFTATEIAVRFHRETGIGLSPAHVGMAARALRLPYAESAPLRVPGHPGIVTGPIRHYAAADVPRIFDHLRQLAEGRIRQGGSARRPRRHGAGSRPMAAPEQGSLPF